MSWSKLKGILKRLDDRLTDAVYLHGCHLTGQKTVGHREETLDQARPGAVIGLGKDKRRTLSVSSQRFGRVSPLDPRRDAVQW